MGSSQIKIKKSERELKRDIQELNNITKSKKFEGRVGFNINFDYSHKLKKIITHFVNFI